MMIEAEMDLVAQPATACLICKQGDNDDLVLLCDGPGEHGIGSCANEIHMYCLNPPLYEVPPDTWLCPICSKTSEADRIRKFLKKFDRPLSDNESYADRLRSMQQDRVPLSSWKISMNEPVIYQSEFDSSSIDLIGCVITVKDYLNCDMFSGRIIHQRMCSVIPDRYQHLVQFKSGCEMRNDSIIEWLCLDEIPCSIGIDVVWAKAPGYPWWPALKVRRSGVDIAESMISGSNTDVNAKDAEDGSNDAFEPNQVYLYFYGDPTSMIMSENEAATAVVKYYERSRELRTNSKNKYAVSIAQADVELEERRSVRRAYQAYPVSAIESYGAMVDWDTLADVQTISELNHLDSYSLRMAFKQHIRKKLAYVYVKLTRTPNADGNNGVNTISNSEESAPETLYFDENKNIDSLNGNVLAGKIVGLDLPYLLNNHCSPSSSQLFEHELISKDSFIAFAMMKTVSGDPTPAKPKKRGRKPKQSIELEAADSSPIESDLKSPGISTSMDFASDPRILHLRAVPSFGDIAQEKFNTYMQDTTERKESQRMHKISIKRKQLLEELQLQLQIEEENARIEHEQECEQVEHDVMEREDFESKAYEQSFNHLIISVIPTTGIDSDVAPDFVSRLRVKSTRRRGQEVIVSYPMESHDFDLQTVNEQGIDNLDEWADKVDASIHVPDKKRRGRPKKYQAIEATEAIIDDAATAIESSSLTEPYSNDKRIKKKALTDDEFDDDFLPVDNEFIKKSAVASSYHYNHNQPQSSSSSTGLKAGLISLIPLNGTYLNSISDRSKWMNRVVMSTRDHSIGRTIKYADGQVHVRTASHGIIYAKASHLQLVDESSDQYHEFLEECTIEGVEDKTDHSNKHQLHNRGNLVRKNSIFTGDKAADQSMFRKKTTAITSFAKQFSTQLENTTNRSQHYTAPTLTSASNPVIDTKQARHQGNDRIQSNPRLDSTHTSTWYHSETYDTNTVHDLETISALQLPSSKDLAAKDLAARIDIFLQSIFMPTSSSDSSTYSHDQGYVVDTSQSPNLSYDIQPTIESVDHTNIDYPPYEYDSHHPYKYHEYLSQLNMANDGGIIMDDSSTAFQHNLDFPSHMQSAPTFEHYQPPPPLSYSEPSRVHDTTHLVPADGSSGQLNDMIALYTMCMNYHSNSGQHHNEFLPPINRYSKKQLHRLKEHDRSIEIEMMLSSCRHSLSPAIVDDITAESLWESLQYVCILLRVTIKSRQLVDQLRAYQELLTTILKYKLEYLCSSPPAIVCQLLGESESIASLTHRQVVIPKLAVEIEEGEEIEEPVAKQDAVTNLIDPKKVRYLAYAGFVDWMNDKLGFDSIYHPSHQAAMISHSNISQHKYDSFPKVSENKRKLHASNIIPAQTMIPSPAHTYTSNPNPIDHHSNQQQMYDMTFVVPDIEIIAKNNSQFIHVPSMDALQHITSVYNQNLSPTELYATNSYLHPSPVDNYHSQGFVDIPVHPPSNQHQHIEQMTYFIDTSDHVDAATTYYSQPPPPPYTPTDPESYPHVFDPNYCYQQHQDHDHNHEAIYNVGGYNNSQPIPPPPIDQFLPNSPQPWDTNPDPNAYHMHMSQPHNTFFYQEEVSPYQGYIPPPPIDIRSTSYGSYDQYNQSFVPPQVPDLQSLLPAPHAHIHIPSTASFPIATYNPHLQPHRAKDTFYTPNPTNNNAHNPYSRKLR